MLRTTQTTILQMFISIGSVECEKRLKCKKLMNADNDRHELIRLHHIEAWSS